MDSRRPHPTAGDPIEEQTFGPLAGTGKIDLAVPDKVGVDSTTLTEQFDALVRVITQVRGVDYGSPAVDFARAARLKAVVAEVRDPVIRHVMEMICVKLARLIHSPNHLDSWVDIAGYARTAVMCLDEGGKGP